MDLQFWPGGEILFGLIMVMTFTGSLSVSQAGREDVKAMMSRALGCNLAWAIPDAVIFLMAARRARASGLRRESNSRSDES